MLKRLYYHICRFFSFLFDGGGAYISGSLSSVDSMVLLTNAQALDSREDLDPAEMIRLLEASDEVVNLENLDKKIKTLQERKRFVSKTMGLRASQDIDQALAILEARKKYPKVAHQVRWKTTTSEKIAALCEKYRVEHRGLSEFLPELPLQAVDEITAYTELLKKLGQKDPPVFSIVAPSYLFRTRKGDPILLARSPFGPYYYVLCAWDKEVEFVKDLLV